MTTSQFKLNILVKPDHNEATFLYVILTGEWLKGDIRAIPRLYVMEIDNDLPS
ncbi:hypothetical protein QWZ16_24675 [Vibrio ostreicida]|uniref:Uncharacterized protein n=1 Tax=Vibrio ostreicida TaxID=526588 RepID=A0ABT8BNJ1_9VIBR|nr:hypothetical protein [Vibrio ostreicida]MDN3608655.1 hypothetical protein [Vibrio ostreicida]MDN3612746.1 hypothetical protein [Vibrio ostreicida]MDN3612755.1 hypothetical protein [Vibrio ostreicida]